LTTTTFADLNLSPKVLAAIEAAGYSTPTPIQEQAIPVAVTGRDVLGIAQTGTGKTAAFTMPMITRLETGRARARMPRSLILAPTRELAAQVAQSFEKYGVNHKLAVALLIGGVSMDDQIAKLDRGVDVLIATPGRLLDHFGRGRVMLMGVEILVIDEADRMLDMGFIPDIEKICKLLPPRRQTLFFSATMPPEITRLVNQFLKDPLRIEVARPATTAKTITQRFAFCPNGEDWAKREALRSLIKSQTVKNAIIFCNRKRDVAILLKSLVKHGFNAGALHGDMDQSSRMATLDKFRAGEIQLLAASDVAARGLDIPDVSHVFNFDVPWQADDYVHRIGRTGRAGREGFAATLVTMDDFRAIKEIEKLIGEAPVWLGEAPTEDDIAEGATRKRGRGGRFGRGAPAGRGESRGRGGDGRGGDRSRGGDRARDRRPGDSETARAAPAPAAEATGVAREREPAASGEARDPRERSRSRRSRGRGGERRDPTISAPGLGDQPTVASDARPPREPRPEQNRDHARRDRPAPQAREERPQQRRPDEHRPERDRRNDARPAPREDRSPQRDFRDSPQAMTGGRPVRDKSRDAGRQRDSGPRVGFEDNIPAFLRKPVKA
jgi:superfamily II DNA/RNA helicase